ncbi:MAG: recombination regulator RecX [Firmicutes bacterium]|nr:recombination regulator RecX [Bacillota bacterium]
MNNADAFEKAQSMALSFLARRRLTASELKERLEKKGFGADECDKAVEYFTEMGYINDFDYSERFIIDAVELKRHGKARIRRDLIFKGIDSETIEAAFLSCKTDDLQTLSLLVEERLQKLDISSEKARNSFVGFLIRKGFRFDEINTVLRERDVEYFD